MTVRVHELAKQLDISSKELIQRLEHAGIVVKNNLSTLSDEDVQRVKKDVKKRIDSPAEAGVKSGKNQDKKSEEKPDKQTVAQKNDQTKTTEKLGQDNTANIEQAPKPPIADHDGSNQKQMGEPPQQRRPMEQRPQGNMRSPQPGNHIQGQRPQGTTGQRYSQGQGQNQYPSQGQRPGQSQRPNQGPGQGQRPSQGQGQRPSQGQGQGQRPSQGSSQGQGQRPYRDNPQGRPGYQGQRPSGYTQGGERPQGQRPPGDRSGNFGGQGQRPNQTPNQTQGRSGYQGQGTGQGQRSFGSPQGERPGYQGQRTAQGQRPFGNRPTGDRPGYQSQGTGQGQRPPYGNRPQGDRPGYQGQGTGQRPAYQGQRPGDRPAGQGNRPFGQRTENRPGGRPGETRIGETRTGQPGRSSDKKAPSMQRIKIDGKTAELTVTEQPAKRQAPSKKKVQDSRSYPKNKLTERDMSAFRRSKGRGKSDKAFKAPVPATPKHIVVAESISVQEFASRMSRKAGEVIKILMSLGIMATINQEIDGDTAVIVGNEMGVAVEVRAERPLTVIEEIEDDPSDLRSRPPVVTVMGHVDHGKTSLLDAIRSANVMASEAGGITQHIGAYQVEIKGQKITFLDTPGHEAFTAMRARGAQVTDVAVLVVAADDGIMPQTVEAINHAKAAKVPIVVAINKIDKPGANPERVKQELTEQGLVVEEWGGETIAVDVSAKARTNIESLLEMILLVAEMKELKANPNRKAVGTIIEAKLDKGKGPVATVLVDKGTLNIGDVIIAGPVFGKIRAMVDDKSRRVKNIPPGTPVEIQGLSEVPEAGEIFHVVDDEKIARHVAAARVNERKAESIKQRSRINLDDLFDQIKEGEVKELNIIIKGDVQGSVEAIRESLCKLTTSEVRVNPIHGGVGAISENDVMLAAASNAIILGFNVRPDTNTKEIAELHGVDIRLYRVIYDAINDVKAAMEGLLDPEFKEVSEGRAEVRQVFKVPKAGTVAGSYIIEGKISRTSQARLIRDGIVIFEGDIDSLRRFKDDVKTVMEGYECGIGLKNYNDIKEGDIIEAFTQEEIQREL